MQRIVSLVPGATEILYELGVGDKIFGVTHECKYPPEAAAKPRVISSAINPDGMTSSQINAATYSLINRHQEIFRIDEAVLRKAQPDLIISQETCEACAAHTGHLDEALRILARRPVVYSMDPHSLPDILDSVNELGRILGVPARAAEVTRTLQERIDRIAGVPNPKRPKVLAIEWIEPLFTAGHWVPEMVEIAGGQNMISGAGQYSRQMDIAEAVRADPDIIILMPCGFDAGRAVSEYDVLRDDRVWRTLRAVQGNNVFAVDADSFFSKSGIRTVDGLEILARIIRPGLFPDVPVPEGSYARIGTP